MYKPTAPATLVRTLALNKGEKLRSYPLDINSEHWAKVIKTIEGFALLAGLKDGLETQELGSIIKFIRREFNDFTRAEIDEAFSLYFLRNFLYL